MTRQFVIVAGPNGCGKSSTGSTRVTQDLGIKPIDPDTLVREYRTAYPEWSSDALNLTAVIEAERRVWKSIAQGESVGIETVLSSTKYLDAVDSARAHGFQTFLYFVTVASVEMAVKRVRERVAQGGHDVPEAKIRGRWTRVHRIAADLFSRVDRAIAYDNSASESDVVAIAGDGVVLWTASSTNRTPDLRDALKARGRIE